MNNTVTLLIQIIISVFNNNIFTLRSIRLQPFISSEKQNNCVVENMQENALQSFHVYSNKKCEKYYGILRPEGTYLACQQVNKIKDNVWYIERCFRNETTQKNRLKEFTQFGIELIHVNKNRNKIDTILLIYSFVSFIAYIQKTFIFPIKISCFVYKESKGIIESLLVLNEISKNIKIEVTEKPEKEQGTANNYQDITWECHVGKVEILGAGLYQVEEVNGTGYSIGIERFCNCLLDANKDLSNKEILDGLYNILEFVRNIPNTGILFTSKEYSEDIIQNIIFEMKKQCFPIVSICYINTHFLKSVWKIWKVVRI